MNGTGTYVIAETVGWSAARQAARSGGPTYMDRWS